MAELAINDDEENLNKKEENKDIDINEKDSDINELTLEELKEKNKRSGVLYMSKVPIGMKVSDLRKLLEDYGLERCYLVPLKKL
jgi:hypothetical protein